MVVLSLSYKKMPIEQREKFAFENEKTLAFLSALSADKIEQAVFLSTCNRCEVYAVGEVYEIIEKLSAFSGVPAETIKTSAFVFEKIGAVRHLFSVCCGLDSMVLGEDEILGQVKRAFSFCSENGFTGYELNTFFKAAITSAKKIKTQTLLSKSSVSVATLAASYCRKFKSGRKKVLIVGAGGEIGGKTLKNLLSYGEFDIIAAARDCHAFQNGVQVVSYDERYAFADGADIIISATKSPHYTFTFEKFKSVLHTSKSRLLMDLAVPSDIDKKICEIENCALITIDDFEKIAEKNNEIKKQEAVSAQEMMNECVDELFRDTLFHENLGLLKRTLSDDELHFAYKFRDFATAKQLEEFFKVIEKMEGGK
ncbi:MAG: glutamyl-tRNA reductase [Acutalibacteraceae bacterium]